MAERSKGKLAPHGGNRRAFQADTPVSLKDAGISKMPVVAKYGLLQFRNERMMIPVMKYVCVFLAVLSLATPAFPQVASPQPNQQGCLIVRQKDGHAMLNLFLFGPPGLIITATAKYSTVDSFNLPTAKSSYRGSELTALGAQNVHVVVVNHKPAASEVEAARGSCHGEPPKPDPDDASNWWKSSAPKTPAK